MRILAALAAALLLGACTMPNAGSPVWVDMRAGSFWNGEGRLLEVSDDRSQCRVAVRDRALVVRDFWVDCQQVHPRRS